jgi:hypothetical protein
VLLSHEDILSSEVSCLRGEVHLEASAAWAIVAFPRTAAARPPIRTLLVLLRVDNQHGQASPRAADLCQWNDHDWPLGVVGQLGRHRP